MLDVGINIIYTVFYVLSRAYYGSWYCIMFMVHRTDVENCVTVKTIFTGWSTPFSPLILMSFMFDLAVMSLEKWDANQGLIYSLGQLCRLWFLRNFFFYEKIEKLKLTIGSPRFVQNLRNIRAFTFTVVNYCLLDFYSFSCFFCSLVEKYCFLFLL